MVASITPVAMAGNTPPRVQLTVAGVTTGAGTCTIQRTDASGQVLNVRGAEPLVLVSGGGVIFDYEIPYGKAATYTVIDSLGATVATSSSTTLAVTQAWLIHPAVPSLSQPLYSTHLDDAVMPSGITLVPIPGREKPIPVGDGVRKADQSSLTIRVKDAAGASAMKSLLAGTTPLLVQLVYPWTTVSEWFYIAPGDLTRSRRSELFSDGRRGYVIPFTTVDRPPGSITAQWTWANVIAKYPTWQTVYPGKYLTWTGLDTGAEGT